MKVIPWYGEFHVCGSRHKNTDSTHVSTKLTFQRALRLAKKLERKGWFYVFIMDGNHCNMVYETGWGDMDNKI